MVEIVHSPVMRHEVIELLAPSDSGGCIVDATLGEGGHSRAFLETWPDSMVVGVDADAEILEIARRRLSAYPKRFRSYHAWSNTFFSNYPKELPRPHRILLDLGISLYHYERSGRGFSFRTDELIDMRLDGELETSAFHIVNDYPEDELAGILREYGEERYARSIARSIVRAREQGPIRRSIDLADVVRGCVPAEYRHGRIHPATRTFQALRIAVNGELIRLEHTLESALRVLEVGGRIGVISFHSLEDRIVKRFFREKNKNCTCPPEWPVCRCGGVRIVDIITKRPIRPSDDEIAENAPSRSAKFRVALKINEEAL